MISTFDLTLLGSLVSSGGLAFLAWPSVVMRFRGGGMTDGQRRGLILAAARWLTVGPLCLFLARTHGAESGYLFGPWGDVLFHIAFLGSCWFATAFRITQSAHQPVVGGRETQAFATSAMPPESATVAVTVKQS
jgi:hypothetical protein